jgi:glycosyltransferase involved in cell wall biosynthesis
MSPYVEPSRMNILFLTFAYLPSTGGVQRSVSNLSAALAARGHSVIIAANGGDLLAYDGSGSVPVVTLPIPSAQYQSLRNRALDAWNLGVLAWICTRRQIDIVHCHLVNMDTRYAITLKEMLGVKAVIRCVAENWATGLKDGLFARTTSGG